MAWINVTVDYVDTLGGFLKRAAKRVEDSPPLLLEHIGKRLAYRFKRNIRDSKTASGERFPALRRPRPRGHNPSMRPLVDSGKLFEAITYRLISADTVEAGEDTFYGIFQNRGTRVIPPRAFISLDPDTDLPPQMFYNFAAYQFSDNLYPSAFLAGDEAIKI